MNKSTALILVLTLLTSSFIGIINYKSRGISLTHLNCVVTKDDSIEFNLFYDEKHQILYYADGYTASKSDPRDFNITASKITYHQNRIYNNGNKTPVSFFDEIDRSTLKFNRVIELDSSRTFGKPRTGNCKIEKNG